MTYDISRRGLVQLGLAASAAGIATLGAPAIVKAQAAGRLVVIGGGFGGASAVN